VVVCVHERKRCFMEMLQIGIVGPLGHLRKFCQVFSEVRGAQVVQTEEEKACGWGMLCFEIESGWSQAVSDWCEKYGLDRVGG